MQNVAEENHDFENSKCGELSMLIDNQDADAQTECAVKTGGDTQTCN